MIHYIYTAYIKYWYNNIEMKNKSNIMHINLLVILLIYK